MAVEKRPVSADTIREVTADVTREIQSQDTQLVSSDKIGSAVADQLLDLDEVAYVRFVSVYEGYSDPEDFREVLDRVLPDTDTSTAEPTTAAHE
jgi:transcriptional repressor NrdR